jgi:hypothetical protein
MPVNTITFSDISSLVEVLANVNLGYLAISVTIIVLIGGAFYLFSIKPFQEKLDRQEKKTEDLSKEVKDTFLEAKNEIDSKIVNFKKEYSKELETSFKHKKEEIKQDVRTQIAILDKEVSEKIENVAKAKDADLKTVILSEVSNSIRTLEKNISEKLNKYEISNNKEVASLKSKQENDSREASLDIKELRAFMYHSRGKMGGIIYEIEALEEYIKQKPHLLGYKLEYLKEIISDYNFGKNHKEYYDKLKNLLSKIKGGKHDAIVTEIEGKMEFSKEDD